MCNMTRGAEGDFRAVSSVARDHPQTEGTIPIHLDVRP